VENWKCCLYYNPGRTHTKTPRTEKNYKQWTEIFNGDAGMTSAILDRVLHNAETVTIEGESYRMKDPSETAA